MKESPPNLTKKRQWFAGRTAARQAFAKHLFSGISESADDIEITGEPGQKPRATLYGKALPDFSISHCAGVAIAAVAPDMRSRIGVDIERVRTFADATERAFLTAHEYSFISNTSGEARSRLVTLLWCVKEAYLKALGTGLRTHPGRIEIQGGFEPGGTLTLSHDGQAVHASIGWAEQPPYLITRVITHHG